MPLVGTINAAQISLTEIQSTFDGLRYPATCPATPANVSVSVDSYGDPTIHNMTAPLSVTGCSSLPFSPVFNLTAARDGGDRQVRLDTEVAQAKRKHVHNLPLTVVTDNTRGQRTVIRVEVASRGT